MLTTTRNDWIFFVGLSKENKKSKTYILQTRTPTVLKALLEINIEGNQKKLIDKIGK